MVSKFPHRWWAAAALAGVVVLGFVRPAGAQQSCLSVVNVQLDPVPTVCATGADRGSKAFISLASASYNGVLYVFEGYGGSVFVNRVSGAGSVTEVGPFNPWAYQTRGDWDYRSRGIALLDDHRYGLVMYYNEGFFAVDLAGLPGALPAPFVYRVPGDNGLTQKNDFYLHAELFRSGGHVYAIGRRLIGEADRTLSIYTFDTPTSISLVSRLTGSDGGWMGSGYDPFAVLRLGDSTYVANRSASGDAAVWNVSNPTLPQLIATLPGTVDAKDLYADPSTSRIYAITGASVSAPVMRVYDLSNPASPVQLAAYSLSANLNWSDATTVAASGPAAMVAGFDSSNVQHVEVLSVDDPANIFRVGQTPNSYEPELDFCEYTWDATVLPFANEFLIWRVARSSSDAYKLSGNCLTTDPHANFAVTGGSPGATCAAAPTASGGLAAKGFAGDTFTITNTSFGEITGQTLTVTKGGSQVLQSTTGGPWSLPTQTDATGEYLASLVLAPAIGDDYSLTKSLWLCADEEAVLSTTPATTSFLVGETVSLSLAQSEGHPTTVDFLPPTGASTSPASPVGLTPSTPVTMTFGACGSGLVAGGIAHYAHAGADNGCGSDPVPGLHDACASTASFSVGLARASFTVKQNGVETTAPLVGADTVLEFTGKVAPGRTATFSWSLPYIQEVSVNSANGYTGSTWMIPGGSLTAGGQVNLQLTVTVASPPVDCAATVPSPVVPIFPTTASVGFTVSPATVNIGQTVTFTLGTVTGSFSSLRYDLGGGQTCNNQTSISLPCSLGVCQTGTQTSVQLRAAGNFTVTLFGTPTGAGAESAFDAKTVTVNNTGSCPSSCPAVTVSSVTPTTATVGVSQTFTATASGGTITSYLWQWGDGSSNTTGSYVASHAYAAAGSKSLRVEATNSCGNSGAKTVTVSVGTGGGGGTLTIAASPTAPKTNQVVSFTFSPAVSLTTDQVTFNFGDGQTAVVKAACSPVFGGCTAVDSVNHTYTAANTYLITASGVAGGASVSGTKSLVVASACELTLPSAAFSVNTATPRPGDTVSFTDLSTGEITTRTWNFGDDSTSAVTNPTHVYQTVGSYTASLTVGNCKGTSSTSQTITVCGLDVGPTASFVVATADPRAKQPVQFTDTSTNGPTSWSWQFGDAGGIFGGGGTSTQQHPAYTFAEAGTYLVRLTARNCKDESTYEQSVVVGEDNRPVTAAFSWTPAQLAVGTPARFTARTGSAYGDPTEFTWQFPNENETRSGADQDVTFTCGGTLPVTLRASRGSFSDTHTENVAVTGDACAPEAVIATDAAKTAGANGTFWQTDMWIFNPSSQQTAIWFAVLQSGGGEVPLPLGPYTVGPKATLFLHNVLDVLSQQAGQDYRKGAIRITFENAEGVAPVVTARTFTPSPSLPGGNYGQSARGVPVWPNSTTSPLWISGLRGDGSTEGFRTNFGLANLRDNAAGGVTVTMYRSDGTPTSRTFSLAPFGYFQDSVRNLFGEEFATAGALAMKVEIPEGIDVEASASVVENLTGDPMQVAATVIPATAVHLPAIIRAAGANNTVWRSSLQLTNPSEQARRWKLTFTPKGNIPGVFREVSIAERASWAQSDLVAWLYDPLTPPEAAGVLKITSADGSGVLPVAVARTFNVTAQGTFGHAVPGLTAAMGASATGGSTRLVLPGLSSEDVGRSNLGFVNLSETETVNFQVFFYGEDGTALNPEGRPYVLALAPGGWDQDRIENRFRGYFGAELPAGQRAITAEVVVKTGSGGFAYASVVDNVTGDPIWISGQLMH